MWAAPAAAQSAVSPEEMEERGGLLYKIGDKTPFTGLVQDFHQSGRVRLEARYASGRLASSTVWYENGQLAEQVDVAGDAWTIRRYSENGRLEEQTVATFQNGRKLTEQSKVWDESGQLRTEAGFHAGKLHGPLKEYDPSGALVRDEIYEQGKLVKKIK
jgi:antitoxin component YwqK of YwqJK toxin-antitoxin module